MRCRSSLQAEFGEYNSVRLLCTWERVTGGEYCLRPGVPKDWKSKAGYRRYATDGGEVNGCRNPITGSMLMSRGMVNGTTPQWISICLASGEDAFEIEGCEAHQMGDGEGGNLPISICSPHP